MCGCVIVVIAFFSWLLHCSSYSAYIVAVQFCDITATYCALYIEGDECYSVYVVDMTLYARRCNISWCGLQRPAAIWQPTPPITRKQKS